MNHATTKLQSGSRGASQLLSTVIRHPSTVGRRGFTLIELIVVIIIMAVLSAVAVPSYMKLYARSKFDGSVQEIMSVCRWARDMAVETGLETIVRFDPQTETFIAAANQPEVLADMPTVMLEQREQQEQNAAPPPRIHALSEDLSIVDFQSYRPELSFASGSAESATVIRFRHDGSCDGGRFAIASDSGYRAIVEIAAATGKPSLIEDLQ
jgi:type II secretion system protein H